jgi:hypothetical protein
MKEREGVFKEKGILYREKYDEGILVSRSRI